MLIAAARAELEAGENAPLHDIQIHIVVAENGPEMHISADARYGLRCPSVAARLRSRIFASTGGALTAIHFHVNDLFRSPA